MKVKLRKISAEDTHNIVKWRNNPRVLVNFIDQNLINEDIHNNWLKNYVNTGKAIQYIIYLYENEKCVDVGSVFLKNIDLNTRSAEFGIFIGEDFAIGKGVGKESINQILKIAFSELKLVNVFLRVKQSNYMAKNLYELSGFKLIDEDDELCYMEINNK